MNIPGILVVLFIKFADMNYANLNPINAVSTISI